MEELGDFKIKKDKHTFFPKEWDLEKIKSVVKEASENITFSDGNKFQGITKNGVKLEFYIDKNTREIHTAFIIF
ncbi:EndoU domain-containing protein [Chryseobacterium sp. G0201]|uniref:EndoU domain-containing protein n=1 Tax=Chryseobacterium sp. G0201 TaxID=2487065 RepID=UPI000F507DA4|nr:hypothetical protein EG348_07755 [Chryseobacterium sp. G0201]